MSNRVICRRNKEFFCFRLLIHKPISISKRELYFKKHIVPNKKGRLGGNLKVPNSEYVDLKVTVIFCRPKNQCRLSTLKS